jgi:branched-chain amino acid transport system permease protein
MGGAWRAPALLALAVVLVHVAVRLADRSQYLTQLTMAAYYALPILGLTLLMGYAGQVSIGHAGFFAIGSYVSAFLTTHDLAGQSQERWVRALARLHLLSAGQDAFGSESLVVRPWPACVLALALAAAVAYAIGKPVLRLKGHFLAMATLGFGTIVYRLVLGSSALGAADGISDIPAFRLLPGLAVSGKSAVRVSNYYVAWALVLGAMILLGNLVRSRMGRALRAIHGAEDAATASGVDTQSAKLRMFVLSAVLAALGGVFLTHYNGGVGPSEASIMKSVRMVSIVAIGGMANLWGALVMGVVLNFLSLRGSFGSYDDAVFACILLVIMLFSPQGLLRADLARPVATALLHPFRRVKGPSA